MTCPDYHNPKTGFTLAEMLVVIVIIGIAAMVVIPMMGDTSDLQVTTAARQLVSALLYTQTTAIASQRKFKVVFDSNNNCYEIQDQDGNVITNPIGKIPYQINFTNDPHLKAVTIDTANFDGGNTVWFSSLGAPYSGDGSTDLTSGSVVLSAGGQNITVSVEPVTGRINST